MKHTVGSGSIEQPPIRATTLGEEIATVIVISIAGWALYSLLAL